METKITEPTIFLSTGWTKEEFEEEIANVREVVLSLLIYCGAGHKVDAQMIGRCIDTLDILDKIKLVEDV